MENLHKKIAEFNPSCISLPGRNGTAVSRVFTAMLHLRGAVSEPNVIKIYFIVLTGKAPTISKCHCWGF